jgi:hypothetical protein
VEAPMDGFTAFPQETMHCFAQVAGNVGQIVLGLCSNGVVRGDRLWPWMAGMPEMQEQKLHVQDVREIVLELRS